MATVKTQSDEKVSAPNENKETLTVEEEYALNCEVAERILREAMRGSDKWRMGQWGALLRGQVVAVGNSLAEVSDALRRIESDRDRGMVFEVCDPDEVIRE